MYVREEEVTMCAKGSTEKSLLTPKLCMYISPLSCGVLVSVYVSLSVCSPPALYLWGHYRD